MTNEFRSITRGEARTLRDMICDATGASAADATRLGNGVAVTVKKIRGGSRDVFVVCTERGYDVKLVNVWSRSKVKRGTETLIELVNLPAGEILSGVRAIAAAADVD